MRKGKLVGLKGLPLLNILDDNGKLKTVELEALQLPRVDGFAGDLACYHYLKSHLDQAV